MELEEYKFWLIPRGTEGPLSLDVFGHRVRVKLDPAEPATYRACVIRCSVKPMRSHSPSQSLRLLSLFWRIAVFGVLQHMILSVDIH